MRDAITTALEVAGILALAAAAGIALWPVAPAAGVALAGAWLVVAVPLLSWLGGRVAARRRAGDGQ